jgi:hypothetical protein
MVVRALITTRTHFCKRTNVLRVLTAGMYAVQLC